MHFLVIEDHALIFESLALHLANHFDDARFSYEPTGDLDAIEAKLPIDCIVLDLDLGNGVRYDKLSDLHNRFPEIPIVVLSGATDPEAPVLSRAFGAMAFVRKGTNSKPIGGIFDLVLNEGLQVFPDDHGALKKTAISADPLPALTRREVDVLNCLLTFGGGNKAIGKRLGIGESTVKSHLTSAFKKVGVSNRLEVVVKLQGSQFAAQLQERRNQQV